MTFGERRLARRLEEKLDGDNLFWYNVPIGEKRWHPDFIVMHPSITRTIGVGSQRLEAGKYLLRNELERRAADSIRYKSH